MAASILVIEDHPANLELMSYLLTSFGYTVRTAEDGQIGLDAARTEKPDLIICDIQIPVLDGMTVARELKRSPRLSDVPLLAVTAYAMVGDRDRLLAAGFDGYISKPIAPESFVSQVEAYLPAQLLGRRAQVDTSAPETLAGEHVPPPHRATVLIVDDTEHNRHLWRSMLEPFGICTLAAATTAEALLLIRADKPDLLISDVDIGEESGYDLLQQIKSDPDLLDVPVALISATNERRSSLSVEGIVRFLRWDSEPEMLVAQVEECLGVARPSTAVS